jgi:hypothetical protein
VLAELDRVIAALATRQLSLLDVGTGAADIPRRARHAAAERGITLLAVGVDASATLARAAGAD